MVFVAKTELSGSLSKTAVATGNVFLLPVLKEILILVSWLCAFTPRKSIATIMSAIIFTV